MRHPQPERPSRQTSARLSPHFTQSTRPCCSSAACPRRVRTIWRCFAAKPGPSASGSQRPSGNGSTPGGTNSSPAGCSTPARLHRHTATPGGRTSRSKTDASPASSIGSSCHSPTPRTTSGSRSRWGKGFFLNALVAYRSASTRADPTLEPRARALFASRTFYGIAFAIRRNDEAEWQDSLRKLREGPVLRAPD